MWIASLPPSQREGRDRSPLAREGQDPRFAEARGVVQHRDQESDVVRDQALADALLVLRAPLLATDDHRRAWKLMLPTVGGPTVAPKQKTRGSRLWLTSRPLSVARGR